MKFVFSMTLALTLLASAPALAQNRIDVMTQNQYLGADLGDVIGADDPDAFNAALIAALQDIAANDYRARTTKLAQLIADRSPELVGLQEMFQFVCHETGFPGAIEDACQLPGISGAFNDHVTETLSELAALDEDYVIAAIVNNLDLTQTLPDLLTPGLPVFLNDDPIPDITVTVLDRDVILARGDIAGDVTPVDFMVLQDFGICLKPSANGCNYTVVASVEDTPIGDISIERGWVGVDYTNGDTTYRFVNTHLEVQFLVGNPGTGDVPLGFIQAAQAAELVGVLAGSQAIGDPDHLIIVGDINSGPRDGIFEDPLAPFPPFPQGTLFHPPYMQLASGVGLFVGDSPSPLGPLTDAWDFVKPADEPGFSCCQDADLRNPQSILDERIDVIFSIEVPKNVKKARVLGAEIQDKTLPGPRLWPSDHGSVAAELQFK